MWIQNEPIIKSELLQTTSTFDGSSAFELSSYGDDETKWKANYSYFTTQARIERSQKHPRLFPVFVDGENKQFAQIIFVYTPLKIYS
jgi:hypothetical protein